MPKAGIYRANSVIYFQGDVSDRIYILQSGRVSLNYTDIETGKDVHEIVQTGEFFGVKSAFGKYPREENALVLMDAQVLTFSVPEFEVFAQANIRIIMKMLKVFSNQLRRVHKQVENLLEKSEALSPEAGLYKTGEYYLKNKQYSQAKYVLGRYLTYYPAGRFATDASRYLEMAESSAMRYGDGKGPAPLVAASGPGPGAAARQGEARQGEARQAEGRQGEARQAEAGRAAASAGGSAPDRAPGESLSDAAKVYYDAVSLFSQEKYREALAAFKRIVELDADPEYVPKARYDLGRSLFMLKDYDAAIRQFTQIAQSDPKHPDLPDILFWLGQAYEKRGDAERAKGFYKKIISMQTDEDAAPRLKAKKALRALEGAPRG